MNFPWNVCHCQLNVIIFVPYIQVFLAAELHFSECEPPIVLICVRYHTCCLSWFPHVCFATVSENVWDPTQWQAALGHSSSALFHVQSIFCLSASVHKLLPNPLKWVEASVNISTVASSLSGSNETWHAWYFESINLTLSLLRQTNSLQLQNCLCFAWDPQFCLFSVYL